MEESRADRSPPCYAAHSSSHQTACAASDRPVVIRPRRSLFLFHPVPFLTPVTSIAKHEWSVRTRRSAFTEIALRRRQQQGSATRP